MKSAVVLFGSILLALLAGCATSSSQARATGAQDALAQQGGKAGDPDEIVCVTERTVGTNFPEKICKTRRMMEDERDATQIMMQTMGNKNTRQGN